MKHVVGFLLFLVLAEDSGCEYSLHLGAPLGWVRDLLLKPIAAVRPFDLILLAVLMAALLTRNGRGSLVAPMKNALLLTIAATVFYFAYGLFHGGEVRFASWQTYLILSSVLLAFTLAATFRSAADYVYLYKWLLAVAIYRGVMCWISYFTWGRAVLGGSGAFLTTHDDTIGWVVGIMFLIVNALDKRSILVALRNLVLILLFLGAIQFNSRRLAWVSLAMGFAAMYFLFPPGIAKRRINRLLLIALPVLVVYIVVGWGRANPIFLPLRSFATVSTQEDDSTLARNAENLGLIATGNAWGFVLGSGWGKPYICLSTKYDISGFELWQYVPHNSILGLLAFTGVLGSAIFWITVATAVFFTARVARLTTDSAARSVAIVGAAQVIVCANQLYGDMGIFFFKPMYYLAVTYAIALRLPRTVGAWNVSSEAPARDR